MGESSRGSPVFVLPLTPSVGDPHGLPVLGVDNWPPAEMACLLQSTPHPYPAFGFASNMLACYADHSECPRCKEAACNMLGCDCNDNLLFSSCSAMGYEQHHWWEGRLRSAQPTSMGWEEVGLERCSVELCFPRGCALLHLGLDVGP